GANRTCRCSAQLPPAQRPILAVREDRRSTLLRTDMVGLVKALVSESRMVLNDLASLNVSPIMTADMNCTVGLALRARTRRVPVLTQHPRLCVADAAPRRSRRVLPSLLGELLGREPGS